MTAVRFGLELSSQPKARRDAKEATDARTALRKRWVAMVEKLGPGYHTKRGAEMPDWVAVAHLPSYEVWRTLHRWSIEVPRAIMPNRQRTMHSFYTAAGARAMLELGEEEKMTWSVPRSFHSLRVLVLFLLRWYHGWSD